MTFLSFELSGAVELFLLPCLLSSFTALLIGLLTAAVAGILRNYERILTVNWDLLLIYTTAEALQEGVTYVNKVL